MRIKAPRQPLRYSHTQESLSATLLRMNHHLAVVAAQLQSMQQRIKQAIVRDTPCPAWLPVKWRFPIHRYLLAGLIAIIATLLAYEIMVIVPDFRIIRLFVLFATVGVTIILGTGPDLLSAVLGGILINFVLPLYLPPSLALIDDIVDKVFYIVLVSSINFTIGRSQLTKQRIIAAQQEAKRQMEVFISVTSHEQGQQQP